MSKNDVDNPTIYIIMTIVNKKLGGKKHGSPI